MKKTLVKRLVSLTAILIFSFALASQVSALSEDNAWGSYWQGDNAVTRNAQNAVGNNTGLGNTDPREMAANVVNVILGFLGIIAVILILAGGFMWMTAAGNEDKVGTAKKVMTAGVVGLVIVLAAFGIAKFVIGALVTATK